MKIKLSPTVKGSLLLLLTVIFSLTASFSQSPDKFSYQAVVRNSGGTLVQNSNVGFRISILQTTSTGTVVYAETHTVATNANGLASLEIGSGTVQSGSFSAIDWSSGPYFLKTETDPGGGSSYTISGTTQLLSVPYAIHSKKAGELDGTITSSQVNDFQTSVTNNTAVLANTSKNSYPSADASKLAGIETGAEVNVNVDWNAASGDALILNKPVIPTTTSQLTNNSGFLTSYTETDPLFSASQAASITAADITDLSNLSGVNTGDQDLSALATTAALTTLLDTKVDKVTGKGLSAEDYTSVEKTKLSGIEAGAEINVNADWNAVSGDAQILNKPALATVATTGSYIDLTNTPVVDGSETKVQSGTNVSVTGSGTTGSPYIINAAGSSGWSLTGNSGTSQATDFIGTTDDVPLIFRINGTKAGRIEGESYTNGNNENTFLGFKSGQNNIGQYNTAVGSNSFVQNTSGSFNAVVGEWALEANTTGSYNSAFGPEAMGTNSSGSYNSAVGYAALLMNNGEGNSAVGQGAIQNNTSGNDNSAIGRYALIQNTEGSLNTALGYLALSTNQTGANNTAVGANANVNGNLSNATAIGSGAVVTASNTIQLGNSTVTEVHMGVGNTAKVVTGGLQVTGGSPAAGKVLTSDASGNATWQAAGGGGGWSLTGNNGTSAATNFIGTINEEALNIRVYNQPVLHFSTDKKFGFNTTTPSQLLHIKDIEIPANALDDDMDGNVDESGDQLVFTNYGRLGINTTAPEANLHVSGTVKITDGTQGAGKVLTSDANGMASWQAAGGGGPALSIGDSYQGGIIFWLDATGEHGLVVANDQIAMQWYNGTNRATGSTGDGLYSGEMNTAMIMATQIGDNQSGNFAAKVCADYSVTGNGVIYGDWYLPSKYELNLLYAQKAMIPNINDFYYWSSTEQDNGNAWGQNFQNGNQLSGSKNTSNLWVRAIRAF